MSVNTQNGNNQEITNTAETISALDKLKKSLEKILSPVKIFKENLATVSGINIKLNEAIANSTDGLKQQSDQTVNQNEVINNAVVLQYQWQKSLTDSLEDLTAYASKTEEIITTCVDLVEPIQQLQEGFSFLSSKIMSGGKEMLKMVRTGRLYLANLIRTNIEKTISASKFAVQEVAMAKNSVQMTLSTIKTNLLSKEFYRNSFEIAKNSIAMAYRNTITWINTKVTMLAALATKIWDFMVKSLTKSLEKSTYKMIYFNLLTKQGIVYMGLSGLAARFFSTGIKSLSKAIYQATIATAGFQLALDALGIGLIVLAISALVYGFIHLYNNSRKFNEILGYIGGVASAVFENIGEIVMRLWELVLQPVITFFYELFISAISGIWEIFVAFIEGVGTGFTWIWESVIQPLITAAIDLFSWVFNSLSELWEGFITAFPDVVTWIDENIVQPVVTLFTGLWEKVSKIIEPLKQIYIKLTAPEGLVNIHQRGLKGAEDSGKAFDERQNQKKRDKAAEKNIDKDSGMASKIDFSLDAGVGKGGSIVKNNMGTTAVQKSKSFNNTSNSSSLGAAQSGGKTSNNVGNLNINKLVESIHIHNQNGTTLSKEALVQQVREALLTAVADFTLASE